MSVAPAPKIPSGFLDNNGLLATGYKLFTYAAGTTTKLATYVDAAGVTQNTNPIILNARGEANIFLDTTKNYKFVFAPPWDTDPPTSPIWSVDNINALMGLNGFTLPITAATRSALAAITATNGQVALLEESGREGQFVFSTANLSALVSADTQQGIYVAPSSDTSGASGAWIRKYSGLVSIKWFGAVADYNGSSGTDNANAITGAISLLQALSVAAGFGFGTIYRGAPSLYFPQGWYYSSVTIEPLCTLNLIGDGGVGYGAPTRITFAVNIDGVRLQANNTSGETSVVASHFAGDYVTIDGIMFIGAYNAGNDGAYHGLHYKRPVVANNCTWINWQGEAAYSNATSGGGSPTEGLADSSRFTNCVFQNSRNGSYIDDASGGGADCNNILFLGCLFNGNRNWGVYDGGFLGNTYDTCIFNANTSGWAKTTNVNATHLFVNCYDEAGQPTAVFTNTTLIIGGQHGAGTPSGGVYIRSDTNGKFVVDNLRLTGTGAMASANIGATAITTINDSGGTNYIESFTNNSFSAYAPLALRGSQIIMQIGGTTVGGWVTGGLQLIEIAAASVPNAALGSQTLFIDTADHKLKRKDSSGTVTVIA